MSMQTFATKLVGETQVIEFDFTERLALAETIVAAECVAEVYSGTDVTPSAVISGTATISGAVVSQVITAGTAGVVYLISCGINTSDENVFINQGRVAVIAVNPYV